MLEKTHNRLKTPHYAFLGKDEIDTARPSCLSESGKTDGTASLSR
ncbi:hypothetical protein [Stappia albiluteola]|nr:hypothetical protein [Stappia albiluteola]